MELAHKDHFTRILKNFRERSFAIIQMADIFCLLAFANFVIIVETETAELSFQEGLLIEKLAI